MGGWMTYGRLRSRNNLQRKPDDDPDPYWRDQSKHSYASGNPVRALLAGELNRMERDYLDPQYPEPPFAARSPGSDPLTECATATGVDREVVRRVLRHVFRESP
jgi:hypothetical protein